MRTKVTLFLLFLNVALFFFIFGFEREWRQDREAVDSRRRVLGAEAANIQYLEIAGEGLDTPVRLRLTASDWELTSPYQWPANPHAVARIVNELQFLEHETSFAVAGLADLDQSLADFGLEAPALRVSFSAEPEPSADDITTLAIGAETRIGNRLYLLSADGERVHVVNRSLIDSLRLTLNQLRAENCFTIPVFEVRSLSLQNAGAANLRVRLRREGNRWSFEAPIDARADKTRTELAINGLNALRTVSFLGTPAENPDLAGSAGLATPSLQVTLEGNNRRETLLLGNRTSPAEPAPGADVDYYARMEGRDAIFTVSLPAPLRQSLLAAQEELRDKRVLDMAGRLVTSITLADRDGNEVSLQPLDPDGADAADTLTWQVVQRTAAGALVTQTADRAVAERLVATLTQLEAVSFWADVPSDAELEACGLTQPLRTITVDFRPEPGSSIAPAARTLRLGTDEAGTRTFAKLERQTFVYEVPADILTATPVEMLPYRDRTLRNLPAGARITGLNVIEYEPGTQAERVIYRRELAADEAWTEVFAGEPPARRNALVTLRDQLRTLTAASFVNDGFTPTVTVNGEARPWHYRIDATLSLTGGGGEIESDSTLYFGDRDGGDRQWVGSPPDEFNVVFAATPELVNAMWALTYADRDPGPTTLTPEPPAEAAPPATP